MQLVWSVLLCVQVATGLLQVSMTIFICRVYRSELTEHVAQKHAIYWIANNITTSGAVRTRHNAELLMSLDVL